MPSKSWKPSPASSVNAALGAGILFALACPPYEQAWAAWLVPGLLLVATRHLGPLRAALAGLLYAVVIGVTVGNWLPDAGAAALGLPTSATRPMIYAFFLLNPGIPCALLLAAYAYASRRVGPADRPIVGAFLWVASEWLRSAAFGWELLAHTQYRSTWLIQIADIGGAYLVSFVVALVSVGVAELLAQRAWKSVSLPGLIGRLALPGAALLVAAAYGAGAAAVYAPVETTTYAAATQEKSAALHPAAFDAQPALDAQYERAVAAKPELQLREVATVASAAGGAMSVTPILCLDLLDTGLLRGLVRDGAEVLINNCRVPWMAERDHPARAQHLSMAVLRAVETRRFVVRASSASDANMISPFGLTYTQPPARTQLTLRPGMTRYMSLGDSWILLGLGLCFVTTARGRKSGRV